MIKNHSKDITELLEAGDYVNGKKVSHIQKDEEIGNIVCWVEGEGTTEKCITSIVTKEQFASMEYRLEV